MTDLLIIALATWYVSYAVTSTHGPGNIFEWVREKAWHGRTSYANAARVSSKGEVIEVDRRQIKNGLLDCPVCLAFWVALILLLVPMGVVVQALAVAGAAMLAHSWSGWRFGGG